MSERAERWGPRLLIFGFAIIVPASFAGGTSHFLLSSLPYRTAAPDPSHLRLLGLGMSIGMVAILVGALMVGIGWVLILGSRKGRLVFQTALVMACIVAGWLWAAGFFSGTAAPATGATLVMKSTAYTGYCIPGKATVVVGVNSTIAFLNDRSNLHPDALLSADGSIYSGILAPGDSWSHAFETPGVYRLISPLHAGMVCEVIVKVR